MVRTWKKDGGYAQLRVFRKGETISSVECAKRNILNYLIYLENARLIRLLHPPGAGRKTMPKSPPYPTASPPQRLLHQSLRAIGQEQGDVEQAAVERQVFEGGKSAWHHALCSKNVEKITLFELNL